MVAGSAVLQAEHLVVAALGEPDPEPVDVARHGLGLCQKLALGPIHAEAVVDVEAGDAELDERIGRQLEALQGRDAPEIGGAGDRLIVLDEIELASRDIHNAVGFEARHGIRRALHGQRERSHVDAA